MSSHSKDAILESAGRLFGERGYRSVTVRDMAADAGVSAALVMKIYESKEKLFAAAQPDARLLGELLAPRHELGSALAFRVMMRRERSMQEPWAMIPFTVNDAPDPEAARTETREKYVGYIANLISDPTPDRRHAAMVVTLMIGFGEAVRTLDLFADRDFDDVVAHFGDLVQTQIDSCPQP